MDPDDEAIFEYTNPKNDIKENTLKKHSYSYTNQLALEWKPIDGLVLRTEAVHAMSFTDENRFYGAMTDDGQKQNKLPIASIKDKRTENIHGRTQLLMDLILVNCITFRSCWGRKFKLNKRKKLL